MKHISFRPDPEPLIGFAEAVQTRKLAGGHAEAAHRTVCINHLANIAIRVGRKIHFDPVSEVIVGDEAHIFHYEGGSASALGGLVYHTVPTRSDGTLPVDQIEQAIRPSGADYHYARAGIICLENTHNAAAGRFCVRSTAPRSPSWPGVTASRFISTAHASSMGQSGFGDL